MKRHLLGGMMALCLLAVAPAGLQATSCPTGGATLNVYVYNPATTLVPSLTVSGAWNRATCAGNGTTGTYSQTVTNLNPGENRKVTIGNVLTGVWTHRITFGTQSQSQNGVVLIKSCKGGSNAGAPCTVDGDCPGNPPGVCAYPAVNWTAFPNVITVNLSGDNGTNPADCAIGNPTTCTLRKAILRANQVSGPTTPALIQFTVSPGTMASGALNVTGLNGNGYITIDGTNSNGDPWIVGDANAAAAGSQSPFPRTVDLAGVAYFKITSSNNTIQGLDITNSLPPTVTPGGPGPTPTPARQTNNLLFFRTPAAQTPIPRGSQVSAVRINAGNAFDCPGTACPYISCSGALDAINVEAEGTGLGSPYDSGVPGVTITNVEILAGLDKGVKSAYGGWAVVRDSWVHNNYRGGIQATLGGHLLAERNFSEQAGFRDGDHAVVDCGANGFASHGSLSRLFTNADVSRNNMNIGAHVDTTSTLKASNDYICGHRYNGLGASDAAVVSGQGIGAAYNGTQGVYLGDFASADFGYGPLGSTGNNFFGENAASCDFRNAKPTPTPGGAQTVVFARNNQWANDSPRVCGRLDTTGQQYGADAPMSLDNVPIVPTNSIRAGQTIRVLGSGFNADAGNPAPSGCTTGADLTNSCCLKTDKSNTCDPNTPHTPLAGNCVETGGGPRAVTSVTPTTIVTQIGEWGCLGAQQTDYERVFVSKKTSGGDVLRVSSPYCLN
jgi:hypothetical protein